MSLSAVTYMALYVLSVLLSVVVIKFMSHIIFSCSLQVNLLLTGRNEISLPNRSICTKCYNTSTEIGTMPKFPIMAIATL